jgi:hypothetical protein
MDVVIIIDSSQTPSKLKTPKTESLCRTLSDSAGHCPTPARLNLHTSQRSPTGLCPVLPDIIRNLNLSPTASFFRKPYIYPSTSNGPPLLATAFYY